MSHTQLTHRIGVLTVCVAVLLPAIAFAAESLFKLKDPHGDDKGPGSYTYPTHAVYTRGSFDITSFEVVDKGSDVEFKVAVAAKIEDPWNSKDWDGNGFSLQFIQIYIDTDHKAGSGHTGTLPGIHAKFASESAWEKVVLLSPQGKTKLQSEVSAKAGGLKKSVIIPRSTRAATHTITGVVSKKVLGEPKKGWGYQVVMQSNEGYPAPGDLLTRKVNSERGEHRFGGGNDGDCDPHILDILAPPGSGGGDEKSAQYKALSYSCGARMAELPMVYP